MLYYTYKTHSGSDVWKILDECGLPYTWQNETSSIAFFIWPIYAIMEKWCTFASPKGINYRIFKERLQLENYLLNYSVDLDVVT